MFNNVFVKFKGTKGSFEIKCHYLRINDIILAKDSWWLYWLSYKWLSRTSDSRSR